MRPRTLSRSGASALLFCLFAMAACRGDAGVLTGIDVLVRDDFSALTGQRVALISNHTGRDRNGRSTATLLREARNVDLVRIFSPEHGYEGNLDIEVVADGVDDRTGIPVLSLYGEVRRPTVAMLEDIDTIVFDIQDIGARFYTYISTMGNAMQVAGEHDVRFVVLDRPNPINGVDVAGPVLDDGKQSFTAFHRLPVRHGMTVGELAELFKAELAIDVDLEVIELENWRRGDFFDATGLQWVNPSPNIRNLTAALLYPGIGLLETTNVSVGRGTDTPFEIIGAPWIDRTALAMQLNAASLPGVSFEPVEFVPDSSTFRGQTCHGVRLSITDREEFEPLRTGFEIARRLALEYRDTWEVDAYLRLLGNDATLEAVRSGLPVTEIAAAYDEGLADFRERRERFLIYR